MPIKIKIRFAIITALCSGAVLILTILLKSKLNSIDIKESNIFYIGNLLNLLLTLMPLSAAIIFLFKKMNNKDVNLKLIYSLMGLSVALLIAAYVIILSGKEAFGGYILGYPAQKVWLALFFSASYFLMIFTGVLLWTKILGKDKISFPKVILKCVYVIAALMIFAFAYALKAKSTIIKNEQYTLGVVLGAAVWQGNVPSPLFKGRIDKAFKLYKEKTFTKILVTGGSAPGEIAESKAASNYLVQLGMNKKNIISEAESSSTSDQIRHIRNKFSVKDKNSFVIVSDKFHLARVIEMCRFFKVKAAVSASQYKLSLEKLVYYHIRESIALLQFWLFGL